MRVCDVLRADLDDIIAEWALAARQRLAPAAAAPPLVLLNHLPHLLEALSDWLRVDGDRSSRDFAQEAHQHATDRLRQDFDLTQVVSEYRILRGVILRRLVAARAGVDDRQEMIGLDDALDAAVVEAVTRFSQAREKRLLSETERLRLALEAGDIGTWEWLPAKDEIRWDRRMRELFDVPPDAPVDYSRFLMCIHPADRQRLDEEIQAKVRSTRAGDDYRLELRIGEREPVRWLESRGRIVDRDDEGRATRVIGTVLDISDRKRRES